MTQNTIKKINSLYPRLSEKEKKIADYIQEDPSRIINKTINEVSADLNIADATVFRFCKRLGFKGYQAMKIALASEVITPIQQIHEEISDQDNEKTIFEKIFKSNIQTLENTMHILDETSINKASIESAILRISFALSLATCGAIVCCLSISIHSLTLRFRFSFVLLSHHFLNQSYMKLI